MKILSDYLEQAFDPEHVKLIVEKLVKLLEGMEFDTIIFRGVSGSLIAPVLAYEMGKYLAICRKPGEGSHSEQRGEIEGYVGIKRFIIVDDFIGTGVTVKSIFQALERCFPKDELPKCAGIFCYRATACDSTEDFDDFYKRIPVFRFYP